MKYISYFKVLFFLGFCLFPALAQAHQVGDSGGFMSGLSHPVLGLDHLLAMISVGILSAQMGGRAMGLVPAAFGGLMLVGGVLGIYGIPFFSVELGIAASVVALGIALAAEKKVPVFLAMIAVGFFALFHGHAHGTEMPELAEPLLYASGFVVGTALIHLAGLSIGLVSNTFLGGPQFMRYVGAGIAGIGIHLIIG
jgi:urease accessory protein